MANRRFSPRDAEVLERNTDKKFLLRDQQKCIATVGKLKFVSGRTLAEESCEFPIFKSEDRVVIKELAKSLNFRMDGKYFLGRVLAPFFEMASIMSIVEDPEGEHAIRIAIYNYQSIVRKLGSVSSEFGLGQVLVVKNPLFKQTMDGDMALRSDEPKDVFLIPQNQVANLFPGIEWKGKIEWNSVLETNVGGSSAFPNEQTLLGMQLENLQLNPGLSRLLDPKTSPWELIGVPPPKWWLEQQEFKRMYGTDSDSD